MACEECADLTTHQFRDSADLVHAVQTAAGELERGVLKRVDFADLSVAEQEALRSVFDAGGSPGSIHYRFECTQCGDLFDLAGDTEAGTGSWTRADAPVAEV